MQQEEDTAEKFHRYKIETAPDTVHHAAKTGDLTKLEQHVQNGIHQGNPESVTLQQRENLLGMMPLHIACEHGQLETVEYLIKKRVDIDAGDFFRVTPLHLACIENHYEISRVLLKSRATVGVSDLEGDLPIHWAATKGNSDVIELLVTHKSPVDATNKAGWTPLHRAVYNNRRDAANVLVKLGANMSLKNKDGNTSLHLACFMGYLDVIELLLSLGAKMELVNERDQTPYDLCINDGARETLEKWGYKYIVVEKGSNPGSPARPQGQSAAVASATAGLSKLAVKSTASPAAPAPKPTKAQAPPQSQDDFPDLGGALNTSFTSGAIAQSRMSLAGPDKRPSGSGVASISAPTSAASRRTITSPPLAAGVSPRSLHTLDSNPLVPVHSPRDSISSPSHSHQFSSQSQLGGTEAGLPLRSPYAGQRRLGQGAPLPPIGTSSLVAAAGSSSRSAARGAGVGPGSSTAGHDVQPSGGQATVPNMLELGGDHMDKIRQENRRLASRDSLSASRRRPVSANKKFLERYGLEKMSLFGPS